jgi:hypothetical protein
MSFSNIDSLNLGKLLQIVFSDGVRNQISQDFRDWEYIYRNRIGNTAAREIRFSFQNSFGPGAIQYRNPGTSGRSFPNAQQISVSEHTAKFKEINATIELEYNLWDRARKSPEKYAEPLALEIMSKTSASKRRLSADLYGDGSGVMGQVDASATPAVLSGSNVVFQLEDASDSARGFVGFFEYGDILVLKDNDATASAIVTAPSTPTYWSVISKDRENNKVTLQGLDSNLAPIVLTSITTQPDAGDVFYRYGQPTFPDLTATGFDYGTLTEVFAGLESLAANDGRLVHGITMSGASAGSRQDAGNQPIDVKYIQKCLDNLKVAVGQDMYKWKMMAMAPEAHASLIESREDDRRFQTVDDNKRGIKYFAYVHGNDVVETYTSEYCPKKRLYILPEAGSNGKKVLEYWGSDFETVKANDMSDFHLKPGPTGGHVNSVVSYLQGLCVLICKHPAAIGVLHNFTI